MTAFSFSVPDFESEEWKEQSRRYKEMHHGRMCRQCEKPIGPDDPVFRAQIHRRNKISPEIETVCENCAPPEGSRYGRGCWTHCEACGRRFRQVYPHTGYFDWCCEVCANKVYSQNQKRRRRPKPRECEICGEVFEPPRSDAKTCSSACRQKAYRRRRALQIAGEVVGAPTNIRNAEAAQ